MNNVFLKSSVALLTGLVFMVFGLATGYCQSYDYSLFDVSAESDVVANTAPGFQPFSTAVDGTWENISTEPHLGRGPNVVVTYLDQIWSITGYNAENAEVRYWSPVTDTWFSIRDSEPPFGWNYARSGAVYGTKAFIYGDGGGGFTGLWSFNMATYEWVNESPAGSGPSFGGIANPAWVADPDTGYLYLTGGATSLGGDSLATVYVYNPATNTWLAPLPDFTTARNVHAAFIFTNPGSGQKMLAIAGGTGVGLNFLSSTQCYNFSAGVWNAENADIPALPIARAAMGYTQAVNHAGGQELWLVGGADSGINALADSLFYDVESGTWVDGGIYSATAVYLLSAVTLNNEVYKLGGVDDNEVITGEASRRIRPDLPCVNHGDVNLDGQLTAADAQLAFFIVLGTYSPSYEEECAADCNGDGSVTAADAQAIFLTVLGSGTCVDPL